MSNNMANTFGTPDNTVGTLNGFFKDVYAPKIKNLIPDGTKLLNSIKFLAAADKLGNLFKQPVILNLEHGVTFANSTDDVFNLNPPVSGGTKDVEVRGNPLILRSVLGYTAASRATAGGASAYENATKFLIANMMRSVTKKLEIELFYGQMGYGVVSSISTATYTISTAEWAPGIWAGAEGMPVEIRSAAGTTSRGSAVITSVDFDNRTITLNAAIPAVIATDVIWHKGAYGNEFPGVHKILSMTTGTLFNIDVSAYSLFRGNTYSAAFGALSFTKITLALTKAVEKGFDGLAKAFVNPRAWANMMSDQAALRKYDGSYKISVAENGSEKLMFHSQNGAIEIEPSIYVKEGYAFILSMDNWYRVGSSDVSFKLPGQGQDEFFRHLSDQAGYELRLWTDQALFCDAPAHNVLITGIVNNT